MARRFDPELIPPFPTLVFEKTQWQYGCRKVAGLDEAGRGALAGPLCGVAVVLPHDEPKLEEKLLGVRDSKQMTAIKREQMAPIIKEIALDFAIAWIDQTEIDRLGMARAGKIIFEKAISLLRQKPDYLLIDYFQLPDLAIRQTSLVKGDQRSLSVACASVLAKQARDQKMTELSDDYPLYNFGQNKGYATPEHLEAIEQEGLCPLHRQSFCDHLLQGKLFE